MLIRLLTTILLAGATLAYTCVVHSLEQEAADSPIGAKPIEQEIAYLVQPVFYSTQGSYDDFLIELAEFHESVDWPIIGFKIPIDPFLEVKYTTRGDCLRIIKPMREYWPFIFEWQTTRAVNDLIGNKSNGGVAESAYPVGSGFSAPFISYWMGIEHQASILFHESDETDESVFPLDWRKVYIVEVAVDFTNEELSLLWEEQSDSILASWAMDSCGNTDANGTRPCAMWLYLEAEEIGHSLAPVFSSNNQFNLLPSIAREVVTHEKSGVDEYISAIPAIEDEVLVIRLAPSITEEEYAGLCIEDLLAELSQWDAVHVGVFRLDDRLTQLLMFRGAAISK